MTDRLGTEGDDFIRINPGDVSVDGLGGQDFIDINLDTPEFGVPSGPETFTLTTDRVSDVGGRINLALTSIEIVRLTIDNPDLVTIDASGLSPVAGTPIAAIIDLLDDNSNVIGSPFRDIIAVSGTGNFVDAGGGIDQVTVFPTGSARYQIEGDGDATIVVQVGIDGSRTELLRALNVERIGLEPSSGFEPITIDATQSNTRARFDDGSTNDEFIGSALNDSFTLSGASNTSTDIVTGNGGQDNFRFGFDAGFARFDFVTITDFRPDDFIDLNSVRADPMFEATSFIGTAQFTGSAGEYRYFTNAGQTFVQFDGNGDGASDGTLTIANGEFRLEQTNVFSGLEGFENTIHHLVIAGFISGTDEDEDFVGTEGVDRFFASTGDDTIDGGRNVDTAGVSGNRAEYTVTQTSTGVFEVSGADGTDTLTNVEFLQFDDETIRLLPGLGVSVTFDASDPASYQAAMNAIRDFKGNDLGGDGSWQLIGSYDVNGDGDVDNILVNDAIGRFATVGTADDGLVYFSDHGWAGETRVAGIYIDPLVQNGTVEQGGPFDSQQRFRNDLRNDNIGEALGSNDYNDDGIWEVFFALADGTAYLRALMHGDGNIRYANYRSEEQVRNYLEANGFGEETFGDWFGGNTGSGGTGSGVVAASAAASGLMWQPQDMGISAEFFG